MTLPLPGYETVRGDQPRGRTVPTNTGTAFMVGETAGGPTGPQRATSLDEFTALAGGRVAYSVLYDAVETHFREGGGPLYWSRVASDGAETASLDLLDGTAAVTLVVSAGGPGVYANDWDARVLTPAEDATIPVGYFRIEVRDADGGLVAFTPNVADKLAALNYAAANWSAAVLESGVGAGAPVAADWTALAGGVDDRAGIDDDSWQAALDALHALLGPGQVSMPGRTSGVAHLALAEHARLRNRHALWDLPDTSDEATLLAAMAAISAAPENGARYGAAMWPWALVPGLAPFTTRLVPFSAVQSGLHARVDALGNPNEPAAGEDPRKSPRWALGLSQPDPGDAVRTRLNNAGVNVALVLNGRVVQYGNRTAAQEATDPVWLQASGSRCMMAITAQGNGILSRFVHEQNQKGVLTGRLAGEIVAEVLGPMYEKGALYGDSPGEAFAVDTGPNVNTPQSVARGELRVSIAARVTPGVDRAVATLVRVPITEAVA